MASYTSNTSEMILAISHVYIYTHTNESQEGSTYPNLMPIDLPRQVRRGTSADPPIAGGGMCFGYGAEFEHLSMSVVRTYGLLSAPLVHTGSFQECCDVSADSQARSS